MVVRSDAGLSEILEYETIAVVGCSATPGKDAHEIPKYLRDNGYDVIPVNPYADAVFGRDAYDSLSDVQEEVDVVDVFRPSDEVPGIVDEAIDRGDVKAIWLQLGIEHDDAADAAEAAGIDVVQDKCMKVEHRRLIA